MKKVKKNNADNIDNKKLKIFVVDNVSSLGTEVFQSSGLWRTDKRSKKIKLNMSNDSPKKGKLYSGLSVTKDVLYSMFVLGYNLKLYSSLTTLYVLLRTKEKIRYHEV